MKIEIGSRKEILKAGRETDKLEKKGESEERKSRKPLHQSVCSLIYSTSLAEMNMSTQVEVLSSWGTREQECAEALGKVVIALYSGHYTDHIYPCKRGWKNIRLLSRVGHCFTLRRRTALTSSTKIMKIKI
jgi:hypothetical protein